MLISEMLPNLIAAQRLGMAFGKTSGTEPRPEGLLYLRLLTTLEAVVKEAHSIELHLSEEDFQAICKWQALPPTRMRNSDKNGRLMDFLPLDINIGNAESTYFSGVTDDEKVAVFPVISQGDLVESLG